MNDYFDELETSLRDATRRRAHLPWYARLGQLSMRHRGVAAVVMVFVVATPAVAAVGAASGWFSKGSSDIYYPASAASGLGKVLPKDGRLLPIRVPDPAGGPPWGIRLVKTTRGETCIQVGRVVAGQIGALGIDDSWGNDHKFHEIKPNDQLADICGATDAAGNGFVNDDIHGAPASVDVPIYNGRHIFSPASSLRMIEVGILGPDAKSITYKTPSGQLKTEQTSGGVGAYLVVFRQTSKDCSDFAGPAGCEDGGAFGTATLSGHTSVEKITYTDGKTCSDDAWGHSCPPVGWVNPRGPKITAAEVASPLKATVVESKHYCGDGTPKVPFLKPDLVACGKSNPPGYAPFDTGTAKPQVLVTVSFTARQPVTSANSWYQWSLSCPAPTTKGLPPGGRLGSATQTESNISRGERITFTDFTDADVHGVCVATVRFVQNAGQSGAEGPLDFRDASGLRVGRVSFKLPLKH